MTDTLERFFSDFADAFSSGRLLGIANHYVFPTAVYFKDKVMVFATAQEMANAHHDYRSSLEAAGYAWTQARVVAQSLTRARRKSVWVQWSHYRQDDQLLGRSFIRFFISHRKGEPVTIMLAEYLDIPEEAEILDLPLRHKDTALA